ncbi:MAG: FKBP-type peptidyl-prolyl cis-trans isomerase [Thermoplasmatota archaeon]
MRSALALILALAGLAGCLGPVGQPDASCPPPPTGDFLVSSSNAWPSTYNPGEPTDLLYLGTTETTSWLETWVTDGNDTRGYGHGAPLPFEDVRFTPPNGTVHFGALRVPDASTDPGLVASWRQHSLAVPEGCEDHSSGLTINWGARPVAGRTAAPGQGAHVWYAGFWENGTMFDTNLQDLDVGSGWPKAGWYEGGHWDPIPVYIYDQDRTEQPAYWKSPFSGTPAAGSPADEQAGAGYFTTIKGFNEAVKSIPVGTRQVFHLAPEDAYTLPGREDHPLYGDALVFLVEVQDVVDAPCPSPPAVRGACGLADQARLLLP